ncbi:hypothetical protein KP509_21G019300 [Ceratopteris richardii]|uniref:RNA-binding protein Luc7-like 2 n=2 Tax=Ceratopteris richardii TaxID=49495 RepID=A0A8T2S9Y7_CERRI|nr:hypothetical protein KP509_21G019300 [Ceratopteris richardii]KAH7314766.1 hypothetical protein KP509_21G019300 [Ceratopteris richardii]KAH7314767.1 hypothetical protein KP509_21G019300 [Ceratopteris richardii]KAH7314768.1 hypothetical protein KP509_21G019300 [Ceratopteris richardii]
MDAFRKQLDSLMGANRNGDVEVVKRKYYDRDVCRLYTAGLCPHDLFQLTKMDLGPCTKIHSLQLRKEYEEAKAKGKDNYDRELEEALEKLVLECDRKIQRALKRLEAEDAKAATAIQVSEVTKSPEAAEYTRQIKEKLKEAEYLDLEGRTDEKIRIMEQVEDLRNKRADRQALSVLDAFNKDRASMPQPLQGPPTLAPLPLAPDARTQEMIKEKLKRAEELGEEGRVDEAQKLMNEADALKKLVRAEPITDPAKQAALDVRITDQKLRVCDICGAFLSVYDSDRRLADHFGGKLHLGYIQIREKLEDLKAAQEELRKSRKSERADDDRHVRGTSRDRDRHEGDKDRRSDYDRERRERSRDRTHDRYSRERDRGSVDRDRDYDRRRRDREGVRSHSRSRSRSRERGSGRYRERESSDYHRDSYSRYDRR